MHMHAMQPVSGHAQRNNHGEARPAARVVTAALVLPCCSTDDGSDKLTPTSVRACPLSTVQCAVRVGDRNKGSSSSLDSWRKQTDRIRTYV